MLLLSYPPYITLVLAEGFVNLVVKLVLVKLTISLSAKYCEETCAVGSLPLFIAKAVLY